MPAGICDSTPGTVKLVSQTVGTYSIGYAPPSSDKSGNAVQFCHQETPTGPIMSLFRASNSAYVFPPYARPRFWPGTADIDPAEPPVELPALATLPDVPVLAAAPDAAPLATAPLLAIDPLEPAGMRIASSGTSAHAATTALVNKNAAPQNRTCLDKAVIVDWAGGPGSRNIRHTR